ncbi:hypothetical protein AB0C18_29115 [Nonomuraea muscovyensis]|uniref:hypothetical protein n=1 Tax=Nonomuraea muscovyensis TaxID=1124761 RepID=UPI0033E26278
MHVDVRCSPGATLFSVVRNVLGGTSSGVPASWSRAVRGALPAGAAVVRPLLDDDWQLVADKTGATRLGFCLLLMFFELDARFPRHAGEIPKAAVEYVVGEHEHRRVPSNSPHSAASDASRARRCAISLLVSVDHGCSPGPTAVLFR